jgi:hypothetical protein
MLQASDPWKIRILPQVAFGVHPAGLDGLTPDLKDIVVLHHFLGTWQAAGRAPVAHRKMIQILGPVMPWAQ